jgi:hypothetical protein
VAEAGPTYEMLLALDANNPRRGVRRSVLDKLGSVRRPPAHPFAFDPAQIEGPDVALRWPLQERHCVLACKGWAMRINVPSGCASRAFVTWPRHGGQVRKAENRGMEGCSAPPPCEPDGLHDQAGVKGAGA